MRTQVLVDTAAAKLAEWAARREIELAHARWMEALAAPEPMPREVALSVTTDASACGYCCCCDGGCVCPPEHEPDPWPSLIHHSFMTPPPRPPCDAHEYMHLTITDIPMGLVLLPLSHRFHHRGGRQQRFLPAGSGGTGHRAPRAPLPALARQADGHRAGGAERGTNRGFGARHPEGQARRFEGTSWRGRPALNSRCGFWSPCAHQGPVQDEIKPAHLLTGCNP